MLPQKKQNRWHGHFLIIFYIKNHHISTLNQILVLIENLFAEFYKHHFFSYKKTFDHFIQLK